MNFTIVCKLSFKAERSPPEVVQALGCERPDQVALEPQEKLPKNNFMSVEKIYSY